MNCYCSNQSTLSFEVRNVSPFVFEDRQVEIGNVNGMKCDSCSDFLLNSTSWDEVESTFKNFNFASPFEDFLNAVFENMSK